MKRVIFFLLSISVFVASCGNATTTVVQPKLLNDVSYSKCAAPFAVTPLQADIQVIVNKRISYYLEVNELVRAGGEDNIVATAVKEALDVYGGDVIVGLQTQKKVDAYGRILSINITGFPAKYVNFRPATDVSPVLVGEKGVMAGFGAADKKSAEDGGGLSLFGKKK
ncbi:MAG: hypothetical protein IKP46_06500 [Bacteroidales bacterium]|nr:hypothetical protein [Bacteroidales bacterium]